MLDALWATSDLQLRPQEWLLPFSSLCGQRGGKEAAQSTEGEQKQDQKRVVIDKVPALPPGWRRERSKAAPITHNDSTALSRRCPGRRLGQHIITM